LYSRTPRVLPVLSGLREYREYREYVISPLGAGVLRREFVPIRNTTPVDEDRREEIDGERIKDRVHNCILDE
jgi:hypothetical protein